MSKVTLLPCRGAQLSPSGWVERSETDQSKIGVGIGIGVEKKRKVSGRKMLICTVQAEAMKGNEPRHNQVKPIDTDSDTDPDTDKGLELQALRP